MREHKDNAEGCSLCYERREHLPLLSTQQEANMITTTQSELSLAYEALTKVRAFQSRTKPNHLEINARWRVFVGIVYQAVHKDADLLKKKEAATACRLACNINNNRHEEALAPLVAKHNQEAERIVNGREALRIVRQDDFPNPQIGQRTMEWAQARVAAECKAVEEINQKSVEYSSNWLAARQAYEDALKGKLTLEGVDEEDIARIAPALTKL